jgi:hypothetical protein
MLALNPALVVFTRLPEIGEVKTRLSPFLSPWEAMELQRCFILDTLSLVRRVKNCSLVIAYTPEKGDLLLDELRKNATVIFQRGVSLGERMGNALEDVFNAGYTPEVLMGTDIPTLPLDFLREALEALKKKDIVIGPSVDGGYYLVGMGRPQRRLFEGISWGTPGVLNQTLRRIRKMGLTFACLEGWYDVDTPEDIIFLRDHIEALKLAGKEYPWNTYEFLKRLELLR